jgi:nitrite reductase (NO-forming)
MKYLVFSLFVMGMAVILITTTAFRNTATLPSVTGERILTGQTDPADAKYAKGAQIYKEKCVVCHQATGLGLPPAFPPLKGSDYLKADKVRAVAQVLNGSNQPIQVNGVTYTTPMPPQVNTKEDAVAVINYVLNAWGNNGGTVTLEQVKDIKINPR